MQNKEKVHRFLRPGKTGISTLRTVTNSSRANATAIREYARVCRKSIHPKYGIHSFRYHTNIYLWNSLLDNVRVSTTLAAFKTVHLDNECCSF